jgi:glutathione S-transferase
VNFHFSANPIWLWLVHLFIGLGVNAGFRSPEDTKKTIMNPVASPTQNHPNEYVDRVRRIHLNDVENIPLFLFAGLLYVLTEPSQYWSGVLFFVYVLTRLLHFAAYLSAQMHEVRAMLWTPGSIILIYMTACVGARAF